MTLAYGKQSHGGLALGSLDLLDAQRKLDILPITAKAAGGTGEGERELWLSFPDCSCDVVIMNPPFTRATVHEADRLNVPNPMFAAFASTAEEQKLMSEATNRLTAGTSARGNAGEASIFLVLGDRKLRSGGMLALVMPLSLMLGDSWEPSRVHLSRYYSDLILVTIANSGHEGMSFSADTGMAECLVIGRKSPPVSRRATFVVLQERPAYPMLGAGAADQIRAACDNRRIKRLEDGPVGGTLLYFGDDVIGEVIDAPLPGSGCWNVARIADLSLAQAAYQLAIEHRVWLPSMNENEASMVAITTIDKISRTGPIHRDINGKTPDGKFRGPFDIIALLPNRQPTYPALWSHEADRERSMAFGPDSEAIPRQGANDAEKEMLSLKVQRVWASASHCHFNCDFRFNSQSTAMQFTPQKAIGGTAWLSVSLGSVNLEKSLAVWANTTLGLLLRWWHSNKQQDGRGRIGKSMLGSMPVLNVAALSQKQLASAAKIFDEMCDEKLLPIHEIDHDLVRRKLDERFATEVLGLASDIIEPDGPMDLLRKRLAAEPSIRGGK